MQSSDMDKQQPYAIIIGLDSLQGLQTARILARRQVPIIGVAKNPGYFSYALRDNQVENRRLTDRLH